MNDPDDSFYFPTLRAALLALEACTLAELGALEMYHIRRVKRIVAKREALAAAEKVRAERAVILPHLRVVAQDDGEGGYDLTPAGEVALPDSLPVVDPYAIVPEEDDDDPDDQDATPLEVVDPPSAEDVAAALAFFRGTD